MSKKEFKAESKRLMDLMINSIYTNKEIFLRELISNASDALDKLHYRSLTDKKLNVNVDDLEIKIELNKEDRTLTIEDNGLRNDKTRVRRKFRKDRCFIFIKKISKTRDWEKIIF